MVFRSNPSKKDKIKIGKKQFSFRRAYTVVNGRSVFSFVALAKPPQMAMERRCEISET